MITGDCGASHEDAPRFFPVGPLSDLADGERLFLEVNGKPVVIIYLGGELFALGDVCTHDGGPLGDGDIEGHEIICPRHGARFDLINGKALTAPAFVDDIVYRVRVRDGLIEIGVME